MIKAIAIDDEPLALKILEHHCEKIEGITLEKTFTNHSEAIEYLNNFPVDVMFLDIEMPQKNGIEFYKSLEKKVLVIFTTAYDQYAVEGFNVSAVDYVMKPISFERLSSAVQKVFKVLDINLATNDQNYILIRADYKLNKIFTNEIEYIEGLDDYVQIYIQNKSKIVARMSLKAILEKLSPKEFIRIHRSFIVPFKKIKSFQNKQIELENITIPVGETYKQQVIERLNKI